MKVAYVGNFGPSWSTETHVAASFELAGHDVVRVQEAEGVWYDVPAIARRERADVVLWTHTYSLDRNLAAQTAGLGALGGVIPTVAYHLDKFWDLPRQEQIAIEPWFRCDLVVTADGGNEGRWAAAGVNHQWLPPAVYQPQAVVGRYREEMASPIAFCGSWRGYHPEWPHRRDLILRLREHYGQAFQTWPRGEQVRGGDLADLYASVDVLVGDSCMVGGTGRYFCVDEETEALTDEGWKRYDALRIGDRVLALDHTTGLTAWEPVLAVNAFSVTDEPMRLLDGERHSSLTTLDHRWPVIRRTSVVAEPLTILVCPECGLPGTTARGLGVHRRAIHGVIGNLPQRKLATAARDWRTTATLQESDRFVCSAPCAELPTEAKWSDAFVEIVAWAWTEGCVDGKTGQYRAIVQSEKANPRYVARIRAALTALCGPPRARLLGVHVPAWRETMPNARGLVSFRITAALSRLVSVVAPRHMVHGWFPATLTQAQLRLFVETSIDADGCRAVSYRKGTACIGVSIAQKDPRRLDAFEAACALLGLATNRTSRGSYWQVVVKRRDITAPLRRGLTLTDAIVQHTGTVWCPTTSSGTWLARRRGTTYFTGNSDRVPETLGRGGFLVHPDTDWGGQYQPGEHFETWPLGDFDGLFALVDAALADPDGRREIAAAGRAHVLERHTYTVRADQIAAMVAELMAASR